MIGDKQDTEMMLLNCCIMKNDILMECRVNAEMFGVYRSLFTKLVSMVAKGPVNRRDMDRAANEHEKSLLEQMSYAHTGNWKFFEDKLIKHWSVEKIHTAFRMGLDLDLDDAIETVEKAISEVAQIKSPARSGKLVDLLLPVLTKIKDGGHAKGVMFGFKQIDEATMGAKPGQLIVIGARPSQGKSALMSHLLRNVGKSDRTGVITIESSDEELALRVISGESQIDSRLLMAGVITPLGRSHLVTAGHEIAKYGEQVWVHDQPGITLSEVHSVCRRMAKDGVKVVFIDYLQLIRINGKATKREEVAEVSTGLKTIARELGIAVVALAQLGRDADERRPGMGDIQHASQVEQDADQVWLIYHKRDQEGKVENSRIILEKVRDGSTRDVLVDFLRPVMTFKEKDEDGSF